MKTSRLTRKLLVLALWAVCVFMLPSSAPARTVLELDVAQQPVPLADWGDWWIEPTATASLEHATAAAALAWQPTSSGAVYHLDGQSTLWIRFTVPPAPDAERWYLEVPQPFVDKVRLYTLNSAGQWDAQDAGDWLPVARWPVPHRYPLLPVAVNAEAPTRYLLRVEDAGTVGASLQFVSESYMNRSEQRVSLILGIYFGLAALAVIVSVLSALSLRDNAYAHYAVFVALMALMQASLTGIAGLHLWPHWPWWNDVAPRVLPTWVLSAALMFTAEAVSLRERSMAGYRGTVALAALGLALSVVIMLAPPTARTGILAPYAVASQVVVVYALLWAWRRGDRFALWFLLGYVPLFISGAFPLARALGLIPVSFATTHGMQVGIAFELPLLLVVLMLRSQQQRENRRRIQGLDRIDPATGLINQHVFGERLSRMMARAQRLKMQCAVLMIDVVNQEQIQRDFGRRSAEEMPLRVAARLLSTARDIDSVARLDTRRFGMLVEGPLSPQEAPMVAPRVVARCLMPFRDRALDWVVQIKVAYALVPLDGADATAVLDRLASILATVPRESRRAVFSMHDD